MLHWAALVATVVLVAHVQIGTRLLCAACPAVYWHMAVLLESHGTRARLVRSLLVVFLVVYNAVGPALHVNHFPWT